VRRAIGATLLALAVALQPLTAHRAAAQLRLPPEEHGRERPVQERADSVAERPLATRQQLEAFALRLERAERADSGLVARVRTRLLEGDFRPGDLVLLEVQGESTLSDTFAVGPDRTLQLPSPTVGRMSLAGVLRSELERHSTEYVRRFVRNAVVRARPLVRLSIQGEVERSGIIPVPADAVLADALMAAGGTTVNADMNRARIERDGRTIWRGRELRRALASGRTLDDAMLRDGDEIIVARRRQGDVQGGLRFVWIVVSIAGGIYGLSRAF
jgi:protein involved in polysaccharide export with SLBB domain